MNERSKTARAQQGVLAKHDTLQAVQAPTASLLAKSIKRGLHSVLQSEEHPRSAKKQRGGGLRAKRATITRTTRAPEAVSEVPSAGEERVQPGVAKELEGGQGES